MASAQIHPKNTAKPNSVFKLNYFCDQNEKPNWPKRNKIFCIVIKKFETRNCNKPDHKSNWFDFCKPKTLGVNVPPLIFHALRVLGPMVKSIFNRQMNIKRITYLLTSGSWSFYFIWLKYQSLGFVSSLDFL